LPPETPTATFHPPALAGAGITNKAIARNAAAMVQAQITEVCFGNLGVIANAVIAHPQKIRQGIQD
jgi:hypothetical protein